MSGIDNVERVSRVEVIEIDGKRRYVNLNCHPIFMLQDSGSTLKIFMDDEKGTLKKKLDDIIE